MLIPCNERYVCLNRSCRYPNIVLWNDGSLPLKIASDACIDNRRRAVSMEQGHAPNELKCFRQFLRIDALENAQKQFSQGNVRNARSGKTMKHVVSKLLPAKRINKDRAIKRTINHPTARGLLQCGVPGLQPLPG